jgi:hypothetical protein
MTRACGRGPNSWRASFAISSSAAQAPIAALSW